MIGFISFDMKLDNWLNEFETTRKWDGCRLHRNIRKTKLQEHNNFWSRSMFPSLWVTYSHLKEDLVAHDFLNFSKLLTKAFRIETRADKTGAPTRLGPALTGFGLYQVRPKKPGWKMGLKYTTWAWAVG